MVLNQRWRRWLWSLCWWTGLDRAERTDRQPGSSPLSRPAAGSQPLPQHPPLHPQRVKLQSKNSDLWFILQACKSQRNLNLLFIYYVISVGDLRFHPNNVLCSTVADMFVESALILLSVILDYIMIWFLIISFLLLFKIITFKQFLANLKFIPWNKRRGKFGLFLISPLYVWLCELNLLCQQ